MGSCCTIIIILDSLALFCFSFRKTSFNQPSSTGTHILSYVLGDFTNFWPFAMTE